MGRVIHFEIPAGNPQRSVEFYRKVFDWKIEKFGEQEYWLASTGEKGAPGIDGAIMPNRQHKTTVLTMDVPSLDEALKKVTSAGGKVVGERMTIPMVGYFSYCQDPDGVLIGVLQGDEKAK